MMWTEAAQAEGEDRVLVIDREADLLLIVADGAGGVGGGAEAADLVLKLAEAAWHAKQGLNSTSAFESLLYTIDRAIWTHPDAGEAAAVIARCHADHIIGASVGDCALHLLSPHAHHMLTDHQHRKPRLGTGRAAPVGFERSGLTEGSTLWAMTDGVDRYLKPGALCAASQCSALSDCGDALVASVRLPSGRLQDDIGLVIVRL